MESTDPLWVEGEVGAVTRPASGHVYFTLRDEREEALLECVVYRFYAQKARKELVEGGRVQIRGRATVWAPRGRLQFVGEAVRPAGRGALLEALERLKKKLASEGLFDIGVKRALPKQIRVIGVVTSKSGAALHDIRTVAFRRGGAHLVLSPAQVQGEGAPASILRALDLIERHPRVDVVILGRGGGSDDDLMAFNDERVVRRVRAARVPIVAAIGHEIDVSLVDLAADLRAATPSQAAELVVPDAQASYAALSRRRSELGNAASRILARSGAELRELSARVRDPRFAIADRQQLVDELRQRLERRSGRLAAQRRLRFEDLFRRFLLGHPRRVVARSKSRLALLSAKLAGSARMRVERSKGRAHDRMARLDALSPLAVLGRGYAIASRIGAGTRPRILRDSSQVAAGDRIAVRLARGELGATVTSVRPRAEAEEPEIVR